MSLVFHQSDVVLSGDEVVRMVNGVIEVVRHLFMFDVLVVLVLQNVLNLGFLLHHFLNLFLFHRCIFQFL